MREILLSLLTGALLCCSTFAADDKPAPATLDELKSAVADVMTRHRVPAVGIAMVDVARSGVGPS